MSFSVNRNKINLSSNYVVPEMPHYNYNYVIPSNLAQQGEKINKPPHEDINSLLNPNVRTGGNQIYGMSAFYANNQDNMYYSNNNVGLDHSQDNLYSYEPPTIIGHYQSNYARYVDTNLSNQHKLQALKRFKQLNTNPTEAECEGFNKSDYSYNLDEINKNKLKRLPMTKEGFNDVKSEGFNKNPILGSEGFSSNDKFPTDELYRSLLNGYIHAIYNYVSVNKMYSHFSKNWNYLKKNIQKSKAQMLNIEDKDIAYVENKGESIKFQFRNSGGYIPKSIYTYVCLHEIAHMCFEDSFIGHDSPFPEMLCILCVAGYELQLFDLKKIKRQMYYSDTRPIGSKDTIKSELIEGIGILKKYNPQYGYYYSTLENRIKKE